MFQIRFWLGARRSHLLAPHRAVPGAGGPERHVASPGAAPSTRKLSSPGAVLFRLSRSVRSSSSAGPPAELCSSNVEAWLQGPQHTCSPAPAAAFYSELGAGQGQALAAGLAVTL